MNCKILCITGIVFLVANVYVSFNADKAEHKKAFYETLTPELKTKYETIVAERRDIYLKGYVYGLLLCSLYPRHQILHEEAQDGTNRKHRRRGRRDLPHQLLLLHAVPEERPYGNPFK